MNVWQKVVTMLAIENAPDLLVALCCSISLSITDIPMSSLLPY
jgi:hypothetical protein